MNLRFPQLLLSLVFLLPGCGSDEPSAEPGSGGSVSTDGLSRDEQLGQLYILALQNQREAAEKLIRDGVQPDLHAHILLGHVAEVEALLKNGADPDAATPMSDGSPLHSACLAGKPRIVELLLKYKANPESINHEKKTPIFKAVHPIFVITDGHVECVQSLLKLGASVKAVDWMQATPLHFATQVKYSHKGDSEAAYLASVKRMQTIVDELLAKGADLEAKDKSEFTPLVYSLRSDHAGPSIEMALYLLAKGADASVAPQYSAAVTLAATQNTPSVALLKAMVERGAKLDFRTENGATLLHLLPRPHYRGPFADRMQKAQLEVAEYLVVNGVPVDHADMRG